ncbi:MAG: phosphoglycerate kinase [Sphingobacteriales bacterium]|jgi:phosphoglycerate kinase
MPSISDFNFNGKRAIVRVDFNVPLNDKFEVTNDKRIVAALPTLKKILADGGSLVIMSHLGRPKSGYEEKVSLKHIIPTLEKHLNTSVKFADNCIGSDAMTLSSELVAGEVLLLENLRFYKNETKGDVEFAEKLSKYGDFYVNDAFGTAHRAHASTAIIAQFFEGHKCFGYLMEAELDNAKLVLDNSKSPYTAIVGGAKVGDKIEIIRNLISKVDNIIIGGGMAYTFARALGAKTGDSLVEEHKIDLAKELIALAKENNVELILPEDSVIADKFANDANTQFCSNSNIPDGWMGLDIGPKAIEKNIEVILNSATILWNGPMGVFEMDVFSKGTSSVAQAIADATKNGAYSLIGGGDSAAAIAKFKLEDQVSYVSTGGGALLEYLEGKVLPGVAAILN